MLVIHPSNKSVLWSTTLIALIYWEHKLLHWSSSRKHNLVWYCSEVSEVTAYVWTFLLTVGINFCGVLFCCYLKIASSLGETLFLGTRWTESSKGVEDSYFLQPNWLLVLWFVGMPPPVGPRPGMPPMTQAQPVTAPGILNRPPAPAAAAPTPQPPVTKPLFPSAGQVRYHSLESIVIFFKLPLSQ